jgi:glycosyltransferase 2 family protein
MPNTQVLAALLVFRLTYLLIPLFLSIFVIIIFERNRLKEVLHHKDGHPVPGREVKPTADRERASLP